MKIIPLEKKIFTLENTLKHLYCGFNNLSELPNIPPYLSYLMCNNNNLKKLPELPESIHTIVCYSNDWKEPIPKKYLHKLNHNK